MKLIRKICIYIYINISISTLRKSNITPENPGLVQIMFLTIKQVDFQVPAVNLSASRSIRPFYPSRISFPSWWFQPIWKIWVKMGSSFPIFGMKIKKCWKNHRSLVSPIFSMGSFHPAQNRHINIVGRIPTFMAARVLDRPRWVWRLEVPQEKRLGGRRNEKKTLGG